MELKFDSTYYFLRGSKIYFHGSKIDLYGREFTSMEASTVLTSIRLWKLSLTSWTLLPTSMKGRVDTKGGSQCHWEFMDESYESEGK